jgi:hypothetical protein
MLKYLLTLERKQPYPVKGLLSSGFDGRAMENCGFFVEIFLGLGIEFFLGWAGKFISVGIAYQLSPHEILCKV